MRDRWREPVVVLRLGEASGPGFDVPGRRADGTVEGEHFVRHAFRSVLRGVGFAAAYVLSPSTGGGRDGLSGTRRIHVKGPADALALDPVDAFREAGARWLTCSPSSAAVVDTGPAMGDPATAPEPRVGWEARAPRAPKVCRRTRTVTWPDGSSFVFPLHDRVEEQRLRHRLTPEGTVDWDGDPRTRPGTGPEGIRTRPYPSRAGRTAPAVRARAGRSPARCPWSCPAPRARRARPPR